MKMLIVDDSKAMRGFLQHLAAELSFKTEEAEDGREGLHKLIKNDPGDPFTVALIDWDMPVMNGLELVQTVRQNRDFDNVRLMMVTTQNSLERVAIALEAGADDFLMKPVTKESLEEKLQILGVV
ncbi:MAG TPA: response regulator [Verrucomicrobiae bacterium]